MAATWTPSAGSALVRAFGDIAQMDRDACMRPDNCEGSECIVVTMTGDTPRGDLDTLHRWLMALGHTCISRTDEVTPSILVLGGAS